MKQSRSFSTAVLLPIALLVAALAWTSAPISTPTVTPVDQQTVVEPVCIKPELIVFSADWCSACRQIAPQLEQLEKSGIKVTYINIDKEPQLAKKYGVTSLPTMLLRICGRVRRTQDINEAIQWLTEVKCK
jgi:thiol-disulfide isomerase/thioredoxin